MKLSHVNMNDYVTKPTKNHARTLHKLYNAPQSNVPTAEQIVMHHIRLYKWFRQELGDLIESGGDDETMELCMLINVDFEDVKPLYDGNSSRY